MQIINHTSLPRERPSEGCEVQALAGPQLCGAPFDVRRLELAPGAATLPCCRDAATVALVLAGSGKQRVEGAPQGFQAPCTLFVPAGATHEIVNNGVTALQLVVITAAPAAPEELSP